MSGRKLNALEQRLHQSALADPKNTLTQKEIEELAPDATARTSAVNFLLGTGMFRLLKDAKGHISFRAVAKKELDVKKDLAGEESLVLSHIQAAANEGIWTKHLKAKTELHQTVIDRCLKSLVQKQLVKSVKSVKHPTRKLFMLFHLDPSVDITGGPWYTDNELDTEFIKLLSSACLRFIRDRSFPKTKNKSESQPLYAISAAPAYPTAQQIQTFLSKSKITETQLTVEHVEMLLNVLVTDGDVEKLPAFGAALWDAGGDDEADSEEERAERKRRRKEKETKRKRRKDDSDSDSDSDSDGDRRSRSSKSKKSKKAKAKAQEDATVSSESDTADDKERRRKRKAKSRSSKHESDSGDDASDADRGRAKKRKAKRRRSDSVSSAYSASPSARPRKKSRKRTATPDSSPARGDMAEDEGYGGAHVYRAVRQERGAAVGWAQAPCARCPQFDFCNPHGPVGPKECEYYGEWVGRVVVKAE